MLAGFAVKRPNASNALSPSIQVGKEIAQSPMEGGERPILDGE
jgi:hypothetical protein